MRKCVVCQQKYQETPEQQKYCDRTCKSAARLKRKLRDVLAPKRPTI